MCFVVLFRVWHACVLFVVRFVCFVGCCCCVFVCLIVPFLFFLAWLLIGSGLCCLCVRMFFCFCTDVCACCCVVLCSCLLVLRHVLFVFVVSCLLIASVLFVLYCLLCVVGVVFVLHVLLLLFFWGGVVCCDCSVGVLCVLCVMFCR